MGFSFGDAAASIQRHKEFMATVESETRLNTRGTLYNFIRARGIRSLNPLEQELLLVLYRRFPAHRMYKERPLTKRQFFSRFNEQVKELL